MNNTTTSPNNHQPHVRCTASRHLWQTMKILEDEICIRWSTGAANRNTAKSVSEPRERKHFYTGMSHKLPGNPKDKFQHFTGREYYERKQCTRVLLYENAASQTCTTCLGFCAQRHGSKIFETTTNKKRACSLLVNTTLRHYNSWNSRT
jgi:hypothetical protein